MIAKDLQPGSALFILEKQSEPNFKLKKKTGIVEKVVQSDIAPPQTAQVWQGQLPIPLVDIVFRIDGELTRVKGVSPMATFSESPEIYIAFTEDDLKGKLSSIIEEGKAHISLVDKHKAFMADAKEIRKDFDETYQRSIKTDEEVAQLKSDFKAQMAEISNENRELKEMVQQLLEGQKKPSKTTKE